MIVRDILSIYTLILIIFGTLFSLLAAFICFKLRSNNTFIFLGFFSFTNIFTLYFWNLTNFIGLFYPDYNQMTSPFFFCVFGSFIQYTSLQTAAWILVLYLLFFISNSKFWTLYYIKGAKLAWAVFEHSHKTMAKCLYETKPSLHSS